jgi:hypothetical protein
VKENEVRDRRRDRRWSVFLDAKIGFSRRKFRLSCIVHNMSKSGVKLAIPHGVNIPAEFIIFIPKSQTEYLAATRWQRDNLLGVEISEQRATAVHPPPSVASSLTARSVMTKCA